MHELRPAWWTGLIAAGLLGTAGVGRGATVRQTCDPDDTAAWAVPANIRGEAVVDGTTAFALTRDHEVLAVELADGRVAWRGTTGEAQGTTLGSRLALSVSTVAAGDHGVVGFDRSTGARRWRLAAEPGDAPGLHLGEAARGLVFTGSLTGRVQAIDMQAGHVRWTTRVAEDAGVVLFAPVTDGAVVAAAYTEPGPPDTGGVVALDAASGRVRWRAAFPRTGPDTPPTNAGGGLVIVDGVAVASSGTGRLHAFDLTDGRLRWTLPEARADGRPWTRSTDQDLRALAVVGRTLVAGSLTGVVTGFDLDTREIAWEYFDRWNGSTALRLAGAGSMVLLPHLSGHVVALDALTGAERWRRGQWESGFLWPPARAGDRLVFAGAEAGLVAYSCKGDNPP